MKLESRVKKAKKEILDQISGYDPTKINIAKATTVIDQIAWLIIKIQDLQAAIDAEGVVETYSNGATQEGRKVSSNVQVLNSFQKTYAALISKLFDLIKNAGERKADNPLDGFLSAYDSAATKHKLP